MMAVIPSPCATVRALKGSIPLVFAHTWRAIMIGTLLVSPLASRAQDNSPADTLPAIWRTHHVDFEFKSEQSAFRCEEFAWRLGRILSSIGAHLDSRTQLVCTDAFSREIKGRVVVTAPVEATAANVQRALDEISSVDRLVARVNGQPDPASRIGVFPAAWRPASSPKPKLDRADCDLMRAVVHQVLPVLELRELRTSTVCIHNKAPRFNATALMRVEGVYIDRQEQAPAIAAETQCVRDGGEACDSTVDESDDTESMPAG